MNHFTKYSLHSCLTILKLPSCFPLPCTRLSHALLLTRKLRCRVEYSEPSLIAFQLLHVGNPHLVHLVTWHDRLSEANYTIIRFMTGMSQ